MAFSWALLHGSRRLMLQLHVPHVSGERGSHNRYSFRLQVARVRAIPSKMTALGGYHHPALHAGMLAPPLGEKEHSVGPLCDLHTVSRFRFTQTSSLNSKFS